MKKYSKLGLFKSKGRVFKESLSKYRGPFQRDRDRIIHSASFRRLKHKTQVFVNTEGDHFRTRITHSLEVSQIARTLGKIFNLNEDLCETLSLSHDIGHPPFGHAGEEALDECMNNFGGFDHNIQTLRILTLIENKYYSFVGLNLTIETLDVTLSQSANNDISVNVSVGTSPYAYLWNTGANSEYITPPTNGDYWVIVEDANGCLSDTVFYTVG